MNDLMKSVAFCGFAIILQALYTRYSGGLSAIPGPPTASFCNLWKVLAVYHNDMPRRNIAAHQKYGPVVRIGPNTISFSSPEALHVIHGSRQAYSKSDFYKPTSAKFEGAPLLNLFSVQDVNYHSSLKNRIGGLYTKTAVLGLEAKIDDCVRTFTHKLEALILSGSTTRLDMSLWVHLFAFDCLGELNTSRKFGFLESGQDINGLIEASDHILIQAGFYAQAPILQFVRRIMESAKGSENVNPVLKYASTTVRERLEKPTEAMDMLNNFIHLQKSQPGSLTTREIIGALFINIMAGNDVLAVTIRAVLYYVARNRVVEKKLRDEVSSLGPHISSYSEIAKLPYLTSDAVIHESLRIHGNLGLVNERVTPPEGAVIDGYRIPGGTIVGINPWVIHRNSRIFGEDVDTFRPERWLDGPEEVIMDMKRNLFSFGAGPRMCIGKNIAMIQLCKFITEFYRNFQAELAEPEQQWHVNCDPDKFYESDREHPIEHYIDDQ
ncbi:benzoate 4-monooxygenase cytochrome P450 [Xylaria sp. FL0064]|nr:benzoate 4-monooxygenase cytochrome P450 [Xylaria sp. FL0064]